MIQYNYKPVEPYILFDKPIYLNIIIMKTIIKSIFFMILLITFTSCIMNIGGVKGNRNVISKNRDISSDFVKINVSSGVDVLFTFGEDLSLVVEADENLHEFITTEVKNGILYISSKKNILSAKAKRIHLSTLHINEIRTTSGAEVSSENTIITDELYLNATSGSNINLRVEVSNLSGETTSGADIKLIGKVNNFDVSATSGSDINAYDLEVDNCIAKVTSGADIKVQVIKKLDAKATSGGDIEYKGNPKIIEQDESSSGKVVKWR